MKYCKDELKILPRRLTVFGNDNISKINENNLTENFLEEKIDTQKKKIYKANPVDHSIGRIGSMAIGYTDYNSPDRVNAFNKIYADLIIKISRLKKETGNKDNFGIYSMANKSKKNIECKLEKVNCAIRILANFTGGYLKEEKKVLFDAIETDGRSSQIWIQDNIIPAKNDKGIFLFGSKIGINDVSDSSSPAKELSKSLGGRDKYSVDFDTHMAGGNILFIGEYVLVGFNSLRRDVPQGKNIFYSKEEFKEKIEQHFGKRKILVISNKRNRKKEREIDAAYQKYMQDSKEAGNNENVSWLRSGGNCQPIFHLDLFITPAGMTSDGKYRIVIGEPVSKLDKTNTILLEKDGLFDKTRYYVNQIANKLSSIKDFEISRIPMPLTWVDLLDENGEIKRIWMLASYNNCIIQYIAPDSNENYVLLPRYSGSYRMEQSEFKVKKLDRHVPCGDWSELEFYERQVRSHWNGLGFRVTFLSNYLSMMTQKGAARCMTKVIERSKNRRIIDKIKDVQKKNTRIRLIT